MNDLKEREKEKNQKKDREKTTTTTPARAREDNWVHLREIEKWNGFNLLYFKKHFNAFEINKIADKLEMSRAERIEWLKYIDSVGWCYPTGRKVTVLNCQRSMRMWKMVAKRLIDEKRAKENKSASKGNASRNDYEVQKEREAARRVELATKRENWELCEERCKHCIVCDAINKFTGEKFVVYSCLKGYKVPPPVRERPVPPEDCAGFQRKAV